MKKTFTLLGIAAIVAFTKISNAQTNFTWAKQQSGPSIESGNSIYTDAAGNVYTIGYFNGTVDFDPSIAGVVPYTAIGAEDVYISKLDAAGNLVWAKTIGGGGIDNGTSVKVDASGNVYATGYYSGTVDFDPSPATSNLTSVGVEDIFILKLDASGNFVWAKSMGGSISDQAFSISLDANGNILTTGNYRGLADFDPGAGTFNLNSGAFPAAFVSKLDASGNFVWAKSIGGSAQNDYGKSVTTDATGNVYVTGYYTGTEDFDPNAGVSNLTSVGGDDIFILKLTSAGNFLFAKSMGGTSNDNAFAIALDATGNILTAGFFNGTADFDPNIGTSNLTTTGAPNYFISKIDALGNYVWALGSGSSSGVTAAYGLSVDANSNAYITGVFENTVDFDPSPTINNLTSTGMGDIFILKINSSGSFDWVRGMGAAGGSDIGRAIYVDNSGNVHTTGEFTNTVDFDPSLGVFNMTSQGNYDIFTHKMCQLPLAAGPIVLPGVPCSGTAASFSIAPVQGATSYSWALPSGWTGTSTTNSISTIPGATGILSVSANNGCGSSATSTINVVVNSAAVNVGSALNILCKQKLAIAATCTPAAPTSVVWTPATGLSSSTVLSPTVTGTASNIQYSVTVNLSNGCVAKSTLNVTAITQTPSICMVTVDSTGHDNLILWNKANYPEADSFFVYRDIANNNYQIIGKVPRTATYGEFLDTVRSKYSANGDPNVSSWRYKIRYKDSCGVLSPLSLFHKTLFMQNNSGNFSWNDYQIEGQPIPVPVLNNYIFRRDNLGNGNWQNIQILSSASTAYTDPNYATYTLTADWRAETIWNISCSSSFQKSSAVATVVKSKSNLSNNKTMPNSIKKNSIEANVLIYPNPVSNLLNIEFTSISQNILVVVENALGQTVITSKIDSNKALVDVSNLSKGFYNLKIQTNDGTINKKIIVD